MNIFNLFKKKNVEKIVEEIKPKIELTFDERVDIYRKYYSKLFEELDDIKNSQPLFSVGDIVKLNVIGSPEMTVVEFREFDYFFEDINYGWRIIDELNVWVRHSIQTSYITLEYFDNNNIKQTIQTTPDKVTKVIKKLDEQEEILNHINKKQVCPDCGGELIDQNVCLTSFPPKFKYVCAKCLKTITLTK